jgi:hypothetical protein
MRHRGAVLLCILALAPTAGCGGTRASSREAAMSSTFAGKNKCQAEAHDRPFVVEWDATDIASFENRAAKDVVFVHYEGCKLEVVDGCSDDSVPGRYGSYAPPRWTSGGVEKVSIDDSADLYAKLPLGVATFGGEVERGVKLDMEYYVSGVATATRSTIHRGALKDNPACADATHFVYAFNLGAFEIRANETAREGAGASVQGVGVGAGHRRSEATEKRAGVLSACAGSTAGDSDKCRVPIRLALKAIKPGEGPVREGAGPPAHPEIDLAGSPVMQAGKLRNAAAEKAELRDGPGCLADLDEADRIDPDPTRISSDPKGTLWLRASCEMLKGDCESGKVHLRKARQAQGPNLGADIVDDMVKQTATRYCPVEQLEPWERVERLSGDLYFAWTKGEAESCASAAKRLSRELDKLPKANDAQRSALLGAYTAIGNAGDCLAKAGRCAEGKKLARESLKRRGDTQYLAEPGYTERWEKAHPSCKGK